MVRKKNCRLDGMKMDRRSEVNYKNGKQDGLVTEWHKNGQKSFEGNWMDGKVDGVVTFWDKEGKVTKIDTYKDGKLVEVIKL